MSVPGKQFARPFAITLVLFFVSFSLNYSNVFAQAQAIMNPIEGTLEIRNGHGQALLAEEPPTANLKPELRTPTSSEVSQLLEEDDMRTTDQSQKNQNGLTAQDLRMDCSKITMQIFQVLLQNPDTVEPEDYSCGLLNLISHFEKSNNRIRSLEANLHVATNTIKTLETNLQVEVSKSQFLMKELNETVHKETERAIKAENVIARRVLSEKTRVDGIQKNLTELFNTELDQVKELEGLIKGLELQFQSLITSKQMIKEPQGFSPSPQLMGLQPSMMPQQSNLVNEQEFHKIELKLSNLQEFIQELSNRISQMEDGSEEHVNKGITQIFKTYASLAHEIEKETERATAEEGNLKTLITNEIATLSKSVNGLQERIAEEKNRVQVIENRRTADLFEEINRAKSEENRLGQKLKDEMSKAAAAFKRLELHVDVSLNSSKLFDADFKTIQENFTRRAIETEEKLTEQINFERTRALSVENSLKAHLETEVTRAMSAENELKKLASEERERARLAEHELKVALDVETYRAKGVEFSISAQITAETERAKQEEVELSEHMNANVTRLLTDIIKEFTRAQNAEKELEDKISNEKSRAVVAEQGLMTSINNEMTRATDREQELFSMLRNQENSTKIVDQVRNMIEVESFRASQRETNLEGQIQAEANRAKEKEDKLYSMINDDLLEKFRNVEYNVTSTTADILRHSKELELEVRKTVMAEVARAVDSENSIKQQLADEKDRAIKAEQAVQLTIFSNYSDISTRLQDLSTVFEKDSLRLEDISLQISRNLTGDILTLAELFDDKLDDLERNENVRLKKVEEDMKKCCSGSSWRWRSPKTGKSTKESSSTSTGSGSATEGVINKIMQVFGSITEESEGSGKKQKSASKNASTDRSMKGNVVIIDENEAEGEKEEQKAKSGNATLVYPVKNNFGELEKPSENTNFRQLNNKQVSLTANNNRNSRRVGENKLNTNLSKSSVFVQSANSKVTNTFG